MLSSVSVPLLYYWLAGEEPCNFHRRCPLKRQNELLWKCAQWEWRIHPRPRCRWVAAGAVAPLMLIRWSHTWFGSRVKEEERAESSERLPEHRHVSVPQLRLVPEGSDRVHQVRWLSLHIQLMRWWLRVGRSRSVTSCCPSGRTPIVCSPLLQISTQFRLCSEGKHFIKVFLLSLIS